MACSWPSAGDYFPGQATPKRRRRHAQPVGLPATQPLGGQCRALNEWGELCAGAVLKNKMGSFFSIPIPGSSPWLYRKPGLLAGRAPLGEPLSLPVPRP